MMRKVLDLKFIFLVIVLIGLGSIVWGQDQTVSVAILNFQDDTGANAPAELGQKLSQDLHQKIATGFKDLLPRLVAASDAAAVRGLTIDQIAALGKQNGARYVIRGGLLTLTSEPAGSDSKITAQLYADIISADTATLITTVRAEGSGTQLGPTPQLSALDVKNDQFPSSGVGQAFTSAITQLADSIHQAVTAGTGNAPTTSNTAQAGAQNQPDAAQAEAAKTAEADTDLQQLIAQAQSLISSSANPSTQSMTAVSQALEALKAALASKAALMQNGQDTSQADQSIAAQRQALQTAVAQVTSEAASSSGAVSTNTDQPGAPKKGFMEKINGFAGQALTLLQEIQQIRTTLQGLRESSANGGSSTDQTSTSGTGGATEQQLGEVKGVVTDQNGSPVPNAQVADQTSGATTSTDTNGQYDLKGLLTTQLAMLVATAGGKTMSAQTPVISGQPATVDFQFKPDAGSSGTPPTVLPPTIIVNSQKIVANAGAVKGVARDAQGRPVTRALVTLKGLGVARTNSQGEYQFLNVPAGSQQLSVSQSGLQTKTTQVQVSAAKTTEAVVQFAAGDRIVTPARSSLLGSVSGVTLSGSVLDGENYPIAGAKISLIQQTSAVAVFTGANGSFQLNNIKPGAYRVIASKAGYGTSLQNITLSFGRGESVEFRLKQQNSPLVASLLKRELDRQTVIRGHVLGANGTGILNAMVTLKSTGGTSVNAVTRTDQNGEYFFNVREGQYEVRVSQASYQAASRVVNAKAGGSGQADFSLTPTGTGVGQALGSKASTPGGNQSVKPERRKVPGSQGQIRSGSLSPNRSQGIMTGGLAGQVLDAKTSHPIAGATVSVSRQIGTATDSAGNFLLAKLSPGTYQLSVSKSGYSSILRAVSVGSGETVRLGVIKLAPGSISPIRLPRP